jgi:inner membrane protein
MIGMSAVSMLPDADVVAFALGIAYEAPFGHRGASHSLAFAAGVGLMAALVRRKIWWLGPLVALVVASHPMLDALTDGGLGVALLWPYSDERVFWAWRPIPVSPIGAGFFTHRGLRVALAELVPSLPLIVYAFWPRGKPR